VGNLHLEGATFAWKVSVPAEGREERAADVGFAM
jgi:hypothetical protein